MNTPSIDPVFKVQNLTKVYRTGELEIKALRGVDMELERGQFVVLLGASGSGKSTLLNILGGLDKPSSGELWYEGVRLSEAGDAELTQFRRHRVGFVFQFYNLIPSLTARENVQIVTDIVDDPMPADEALERVGLSQRADHFPAQLSGGEQQRVAIARAVAKKPAVLLCDEPTGALDSQTGTLVLEVLQSINQSLGTTTVVITHNAAIAKMADRLIRIGDGQIIETRINDQKVSPRELSW